MGYTPVITTMGPFVYGPPAAVVTPSGVQQIPGADRGKREVESSTVVVAAKALPNTSSRPSPSLGGRVAPATGHIATTSHKPLSQMSSPPPSCGGRVVGKAPPLAQQAPRR